MYLLCGCAARHVQVPLVIETMETPLGGAGFIFPAAILAMTLTSLRLGFGASGARLQQDHAGDNLGGLHTYIPVTPCIIC